MDTCQTRASVERFRGEIQGLLEVGGLRGNTLVGKCRELLELSSNPAWPPDFQWLLFMPRFLNVCMVAGSCNCDCRMCTAGKSVPFTYLRVDQYRLMLENIPTADSVSFSAGDSDPLMNPDLVRILEVSSELQVICDFFTNGLALHKRLAEAIVHSRVVNMINFSLDACTPETYRKIRRRDFLQVIDNIRRLQSIARAAASPVPFVSLSMVAMEDNIEELPGLVDLAVELKAYRVYVEALMQRPDIAAANKPARQNPLWRQAVAEAMRRASDAGVRLELPPVLRNFDSGSEMAVSAPCCGDASFDPSASPVPRVVPVPTESTKTSGASCAQTDDSPICCTWLRGLWVRMDGGLGVCCFNQNVDMGSINDGKLWENKKYLLAKMKLFVGKVFPSCVRHVDICPYVHKLLAENATIANYLTD